MKKYDVIIVGAGNGGLSAACKLAKSGKKTLLIEKHNLPGGCATSFKRGRFEFEASLHELCDFGPEDNPGNTRDILEKNYGLDIEWYKVPDTFRVISTTRNGKKLDVTLPTGKEAFINKMEEIVPNSKESVMKFFDLCNEVIEAFSFISSSNGKADSSVLKKKFPNFLRTGAYPTLKVLEALKMPIEAQDILSTYWSYLGVDLENLTFPHYAAMVNKYVTRAAYIPKLNSHGLSLGLAERFIAMGGDIWYNTKVEKILFENKKIVGVDTTEGKIECKAVILNCSPHTAYKTMIPKEMIPDREIKLANARTISGKLYVAYFGLNKSAEELGLKDYSYFIMDSFDSRKTYLSADGSEKNNFYIALCYNNVNPEASPKGTCIVSFTKIFTDDFWDNIEIKDYFKEKNRFATSCIKDFEQKIGVELQPYIEEMEVATPWTFAHYLGTPKGGVYGYEVNKWDSMMARLMSINDDNSIPGLTFTGAAGPMGDGYSSAFSCGDISARLILGYLKESEGGN